MLTVKTLTLMKCDGVQGTSGSKFQSFPSSSYFMSLKYQSQPRCRTSLADLTSFIFALFLIGNARQCIKTSTYDILKLLLKIEKNSNLRFY